MEVINRKQTAAPPAYIREFSHQAFRNYHERLDEARVGQASDIDLDLVVIKAINELVVSVYDIHPFIDGNTRATYSLRDYLLETEGFDRLDYYSFRDEKRFMEAWWRATPQDHELLDAVLLEELSAVRQRRNRRAFLGHKGDQ